MVLAGEAVVVVAMLAELDLGGSGANVLKVKVLETGGAEVVLIVIVSTFAASGLGVDCFNGTS